LKKEHLLELINVGVECIIYWSTPDQVTNIIDKQLNRWKIIDQVLDGEYVKNKLIGTSKTWIKLLKNVIEAALFSDSTILFFGESGTGKEMLARLVHTLDKERSLHNIILLDCTTIMPELWEVNSSAMRKVLLLVPYQIVRVLLL